MSRVRALPQSVCIFELGAFVSRDGVCINLQNLFSYLLLVPNLLHLHFTTKYLQLTSRKRIARRLIWFRSSSYYNAQLLSVLRDGSLYCGIPGYPNLNSTASSSPRGVLP